MKALGSHEAIVDAIAPLGDGWLSAGRDGTLRRWPGGRVVHTCDGGDFITSLTPGFAGTVHSEVLRLTATGELEGRFTAMEMGIADVAAASAGGVFIAGDDNRVEHRRADGAIVWVAETYKFPYALEVDGDGATLFVATWDAYLYPVDLAAPPTGTGDEPTELPYPSHPAGPMPFYDVVAMGNHRVAVASHGAEDEPTLFGWVHGQTEAMWQRALGPVHALAYHPGHRLLAAGGAAGVVSFWSADGSERGSVAIPESGDLSGHAWFPAVAEFDTLATTNTVTALAFGAAGESLLVGTAGGAIHQLAVPR